MSAETKVDRCEWCDGTREKPGIVQEGGLSYRCVDWFHSPSSEGPGSPRTWMRCPKCGAYLYEMTGITSRDTEAARPCGRCDDPRYDWTRERPEAGAPEGDPGTRPRSSSAPDSVPGPASGSPDDGDVPPWPVDPWKDADGVDAERFAWEDQLRTRASQLKDGDPLFGGRVTWLDLMGAAACIERLRQRLRDAEAMAKSMYEDSVVGYERAEAAEERVRRLRREAKEARFVTAALVEEAGGEVTVYGTTLRRLDRRIGLERIPNHDGVTFRTALDEEDE